MNTHQTEGSTHQIAAEAARIFDKITGNEYNTRADGINLIEAAIGKATEPRSTQQGEWIKENGYWIWVRTAPDIVTGEPIEFVQEAKSRAAHGTSAVADASEDLMWRYHNDSRFHNFVERMCYQAIDGYKSIACWTEGGTADCLIHPKPKK